MIPVCLFGSGACRVLNHDCSKYIHEMNAEQIESSVIKTKLAKVMKLKMFFLLIFALHAGVNVFSQKITLSEKSVPLEKVFSEIRRQTGYELLYDEKLVKNIVVSDIRFREASLEDVLNACLKYNKLEYQIKHNTIIITASEEKAAVQDTRVLQTDVHGTVTDETGVPLLAVTVSLRNEKTGYSKSSISDDKGNFVFINVPPGPGYRFTFTRINYETKKISDYTIPENSVSLTIQMQLAIGSLDDVVVLGFGQTQKKIAQTGSLASVTTKDLKQSPVANLTNALAGRLPGLTAIQRSGEPGNDAASLFIRGRSTLNSTSPLITIDGVKKDDDAISRLDVNEVENITILKDASATALYGVKGANGVIIITTRRGKSGKPSINVNVQRAVQQAIRLPKYLGSYDYAILANEAAANDDRTGTAPLPFSDSAIEAYLTHADPLRYPDVNWVKEMIKPSSLTKADFNVNGGSDQVKYFVNVGYTQQNGLYKVTKQPKYNPESWLKRYNFRSNIDMELDRNFSMALNLFGAIENTNGPNINSADLLGYLASVQPNAAPVMYPTGFYGRNPQAGINPVKEMNTLGYRQGFNSYLSGMLSATRKLDLITPGLFIKGNYSFDGSYTNSYVRSQSVREAYYIGSGDVYDSSNYVYKGTDKPLTAPDVSYYQKRNIWMDVSLNYQHTFNKHSFTGLLLANRTQEVRGGEVPYVSQGLVGRVAYNFNYKYFAEVDAGYNGTDQFAKGNRYGFFPAVSAAWALSEENFMKSIPNIDYLKIRASYGLTGNDRLNSNRRWLFMSEYTRNGGYAFGDNPVVLQGVRESALGNPLVTWEKARKFNAGLDAKFAKGLLGVTIDVFHEKRNDILITRNSVPSLIGLNESNLPPVNFGAVENKGFEIELTHQRTIGKVSYYVRGNMSYARNKIVYMDEEHRDYDYQQRTGTRIEQLFGLTAIGFFQSQDDISKSPTQFGFVIPGDIKYLERNGDGVVDKNDEAPIGKTPVPEIFYGLSAGFQWKGFDLSCLFQGAGNVSVVLSNQAAYEFWNHANVLPQHLGRWTPATVETATYPALHWSVNENNHRSSTFFLKDASYVRLKNLEIGYTFKKLRMLSAAGLSAVRIFANGQNLYTWDKVGGNFDPEIPSGNGAVYPQQKAFNFGLSVDF
jgi:TonB-linked SusC/RagA family outer membrane protein